MKGLIGLVMVLVGVVWFAHGCGAVVDYLESREQDRRQWPTVQGTVLTSSYHKEPPLSENYDSLTVDFQYDVGGVSYVSRQKWSVTKHGPPEYQPASYYQGKLVPVYYNPANHADAFVADPGHRGWVEVASFYLILLGSVLGALLVFFGIVGLGGSFLKNLIWRSIRKGFKRLLANVGGLIQGRELYQCCFCGSSLPDPLHIAVERSSDDGTQWLFSHMECLPKRLHSSFLSTATEEQKSSYPEVCCFCGSPILHRPSDSAVLVLPLTRGSTHAASHVKCLEGQVHPNVPLYLFEDDEEN